LPYYLALLNGYALDFLVASLVTAVLLTFYISWARRHEVGQYLREEGPASHAAKAKTPTMGGVCFIAGTLAITAFQLGASFEPCIIAMFVAILAFACGWLGFSDDYAKVRGRVNAGLSARLRLLVEFGLGALFAVAMMLLPHTLAVLGVVVPHQLADSLGLSGLDIGHPSMHPFARTFTDLQLSPILFVPLSIFLVTATTNSVNFHDGMDGLAAGTSLMVLLSIAVMCLSTLQFCLAFVAVGAAGSLLGFLFFNRHPAKVFMGDTGSLFIGGLIAGLVLASGLVLWFIPLSAIYVAETVSVMAQVVYFKLTKPFQPEIPMSAPALIWHKLTKRLPGDGKRLFLMAPLHHHFEADLIGRGIDKDRAEWLVVGGFWLVQLLLCAITLAAFFAL
jgi:phospho-N-acetylmuramoyl-pentapeptide-transferase